MPIYMDRHYEEGATQEAIATAHEQDLRLQDDFGLKLLTYWFDEARHTVFCLADAPDRYALQRLHDAAHGHVAHEIIEVDTTVVEAFLGRIEDPQPVVREGRTELPIDSGFRVVMFTDLQGSTAMTERLGSDRAMNLLRIHNALTRSAVRDFGGREVKHTGDGFMLSFADTDAALECAVTIQNSFADHSANRPHEAMAVRIGMSAGEPVEEDNDLFGRTVQLAARVCDHAAAGTILATQSVFDSCGELAGWLTGCGEQRFKGIARPEPIYRVAAPD